MPNRYVELLVGEAEYALRDLEQAFEHLIEREVRRHLHRVDSVLGLHLLRVVVRPVPRLEGGLVAVRREQARQRVDLRLAAPLERLEEISVERLHGLGPLGHLELHRIVRPRRKVEDASDVGPDLQHVGEDLRVLVASPVVELERQLFAEVTARRVVEERNDVRVGHRNPLGAVRRSVAEALDVDLGQTLEVVDRHLDAVVELGNVHLELDSELDETIAKLLNLAPILVVQFVTGHAEVRAMPGRRPASLRPPARAPRRSLRSP